MNWSLSSLQKIHKNHQIQCQRRPCELNALGQSNTQARETRLLPQLKESRTSISYLRFYLISYFQLKVQMKLILSLIFGLFLNRFNVTLEKSMKSNHKLNIQKATELQVNQLDITLHHPVEKKLGLVGYWCYFGLCYKSRDQIYA